MPATSRDNLGECWATARRRAWDSGQELDDAPNEARRAGARSVMLSREGRVVAGCRLRCRWDRPQNRFSVALGGEGSSRQERVEVLCKDRLTKC